jgi:UV DNA damage endonuclease
VQNLADYAADGLDLSHWGPRLGCAGKLLGAKVSDGRRIKPHAPAEAQPSLRQSLRYMLAAMDYIAEIDLRLFRLPSNLCPYATHPDHPEYAYELQRESAAAELAALRERRSELGVQFSFHPSQYVLLSSPRAELTATSVRELAWQCAALDDLGVDPSMRVLLHGGGVYGEREQTRERLIENVLALPPTVRKRFAFENDEYSWNVEELLPICEATQTPLIIDVHHHALNPGSLSWREAIDRAMATWPAVWTPKIHFSSPRDPEGGSVAQLRAHHDYIDPAAARSVFAYCDTQGYAPWVMLEAKAKERAVLALRERLDGEG